MQFKKSKLFPVADLSRQHIACSDAAASFSQSGHVHGWPFG